MARLICLLGCLFALFACAGEALALARGDAPAAQPRSVAVSRLAVSLRWSAAPARAVYVAGRSQPARLPIKPHGAYRNLSVHGLTWTGWDQPVTSASGVFTYQFCLTESCAVSPFYDEPVVVTLSAVKRCGRRLSYTRLALNVNGSTPDSSFKGFRTSAGACRKRA
ncbi:MAG TPA: hypothetical protein VLJ42_07495 [Solirubrobacteraceae bacterium]|nr:hypothetical protein [Solirubrobacteraceae bacterium]